MKPEEQRIAIAEACGWKFKQLFLGDPYGTASASWSAKHDPAHWNRELYEIPDYLNDLNAMHEAVKKLPLRLWDKYMEALFIVVQNPHICNTTHAMEYVEATATQRAEAFLRTLNLWTDDT